MNNKQIDFKAIAQKCLSQAETLLHTWLPGGKIHGHEYAVRNPKRHDNEAGSFKINIKTGKWSDFATGESGGDLISLYAYLYNIPQTKAARKLDKWYLSNTPYYKPLKVEKKSSNSSAYALKIWDNSFEIKGTLAEKYLNMRCLTNLPNDVLRKLRFCPRLKHTESGKYFPALIACIQDDKDEIIAIHRIYLDPRTNNKAPVKNNKMTLGIMKNGAVQFWTGRKLIIAEGLEDAISLFISYPGYTVFAGLGGNTTSLDITDFFYEVIIALDDDKAGRAMANKLIVKLKQQGIRSIKQIFPKGAKDFNEMLMKGVM